MCRIKRLRIMLAAFILAVLLLAVRLFFIQVIGIDEVKTALSSHSSSELKGFSFRGDILDRNGISLVNNNDMYYILVEKTKYDERVSFCLMELDVEQISLNNKRYYGFKTYEYNEKIIKEIQENYGGYVFVGKERYSDSQIAAHVIGYCNKSENMGTYGLEKAFDSLLYSDGSLRLNVDAAGRILKGSGLKYSGNENINSIKTTIDCNIQKTVEKILAEKNLSGAAVVVADVKTGGILCMASYPVFDSNHIEKAKGSELVNRCIQHSYPPGSVFKIIVAAAALEYRIANYDDIFNCCGSEELYGIRINCGKEEGHGEITLQEAFEKSCNCAFIQLGQKVGGKNLLKIAEKFGINEKVLSFFSEETEGNLADASQISGAGIGNLSIGQGETEITCLQAAKIAGIVACGGKDPGLYLVEGYENEDKGKEVVSEKTALILKQMMAGVVSQGTGSKAGKNSAGKSGSAQSYVNGEKYVHGWFTGFFPVQNPQYIVSVFTENSGGSGDAAKIFGEIHDKIKTDYLITKK